MSKKVVSGGQKQHVKFLYFREDISIEYYQARDARYVHIAVYILTSSSTQIRDTLVCTHMCTHTHVHTHTHTWTDSRL